MRAKLRIDRITEKADLKSAFSSRYRRLFSASGYSKEFSRHPDYIVEPAAGLAAHVEEVAQWTEAAFGQ